MTDKLTDELTDEQTFVLVDSNVNERTLVVVDLEPRLSPEFCQDSHPSFCFLLEFSIDSNVLSKFFYSSGCYYLQDLQ